MSDANNQSSEKPPKRPRIDADRRCTWRIHRPDLFVLQQQQAVFCKTKSNATMGQRGTLVKLLDDNRFLVRFDDKDDSVENVARKRLVPVYQTSSSDESSHVLVVVTDETQPFRQLAASQVVKTDSVLELGCSTGETSKVLWRSAHSWIGYDTSSQMITHVKEQLARVTTSLSPLRASCHVMDALTDPETAAATAGNPTVCFVDIGGNRDESNVAAAILWILDSLSNVKLIVVKSKALFHSMKDLSQDNQEVSHAVMIKQLLFNKSTARRPWPKHPLQAPKRVVNDNLCICRYHNYHVAGCTKANCPWDHAHCHWCLARGHTALECPSAHKGR